VDTFATVDTMMSRMPDITSRRPRRQFDGDITAQAIRLLLEKGRSVGAVAHDLELTESALRQWVERARANRTGGRTGLMTGERDELAETAQGIASCGWSATSLPGVEAAARDSQGSIQGR
jgi:transposase-like protein